MMSHVWLPLPPEQAVYQGLSTGHYPWTEVYTDLGSRPQFSGVLDVQQGPLLGRFIWVGGEVRGGHTQAQDLDIRALPLHFARGTVTLTELDATLAQLVWVCRNGERTALPLRWPDARDLLAARRFRGALLGGQACSFWDDGRLLLGAAPQPGEPLFTVAPPARHTHADWERFWSEVLRATSSRLPLQEAWTAAATRLADDHPCLDPFAREVWVDAQGLHVDPELPLPELAPAVLANYRAMLGQHGVNLRSLQMPEARAHPLWPSSGLED